MSLSFGWLLGWNQIWIRSAMTAIVVIRLPASNIVARSVLSAWHPDPERSHPWGLPTPHPNRPQVSSCAVRGSRIALCAGLPTPHRNRPQVSSCAVRGSPDPAPKSTAGLVVRCARVSRPRTRIDRRSRRALCAGLATPHPNRPQVSSCAGLGPRSRKTDGAIDSRFDPSDLPAKSRVALVPPLSVSIRVSSVAKNDL
jgi:hypothetical protein